MKNKTNKEVYKAIDILGSQKKLASVCGLAQPTVWRWLHNKARVTPECVPLIVKATNGKCKAYLLRPDLPNLFPHPEN